MRQWVVLLLAVVVLVWGGQARAELALTHEGPAPLELKPADGDLRATFRVVNRGAEPAHIEELGFRDGSETAPLVPRGLDVRFADGSRRTILLPGEGKDAVIRWAVPRDAPVRQLYAHVTVREHGGASAALGFRGAVDAPGGLLARPLVLVVLLPLVGALALLVLGAGHARRVVLATGGSGLALVAWIATRFDPTRTRFDGGGGYQFLERSALGGGVEWALGLDGLSLVVLILLPALLIVAAGLGEARAEQPRDKTWSLVLLAFVGLQLSVVAVDAALVAGGLALAAVTTSATLAARASERRRRAALRAIVLLLLGSGLVLAAVFVGSGRSGALHLDGSAAARTFSLLELAATSIASPGAAAICVVLLIVGGALLCGAAPAQGWLATLADCLPQPVAVALGAALPATAGYALLRLTYVLSPRGVAWAAPTIATVGACVIVIGALAALGERDIKRFAAHVHGAQAGLLLLALAGLTAAAVQGFIVVIVARAIVFAAWQGLSPQLESPRPGKMPAVVVMLFVLVAAASMALPGTATFTGVAQAAVGALPSQPVAVALSLVALAVLAAAHGALYLRHREGLQAPAVVALPVELRPVAVVLVLLVAGGLGGRAWLTAVGASALDHAGWVNPPGLLEIV